MDKFIEQFETLNFNDWKVRASSTAKVISKSGKIIQGIETFLTEEYNRIARGFYETFENKYFDKGKWKEEDTLSVMQKTILRGHLPIKNKVRETNDFVSGECDVHISKLNLIVDAKNAFNWKTFGDAELTEAYEWQGRSYMWLWDADKFILFYVLLNLPEHQMEDLEKKLFYSNKSYVTFENPDYIKKVAKLRDRYNFEKFPIEDRFKAFQIERDKSKEDQIAEMVSKCRIWLNDYHQKQLDLRSANRILMGLK